MTDRAWPPEVAESDAKGEIKAIYQDIKVVLGVPMVNLLYRRLAAEPAALAWAWGAIRSAAVVGELERGARTLSRRLAKLRQSSLPKAAFRCVGVDSDALESILAVIAVYNFANLRNLIGTSLWGALLEGKPHIVPRPARATVTSLASRADNISLPPMIGIDRMDSDTATMVRGLLKWRDPNEPPSIPSLYRHLAHWPGFLALALATLEPQFSSGAIARTQHAVRSAARAAAEDILARGAPEPPTPPEGKALALAKEIAATYPTKISDLVVVGHVLASLYAHPPAT